MTYSSVIYLLDQSLNPGLDFGLEDLVHMLCLYVHVCTY